MMTMMHELLSNIIYRLEMNLSII